MPKIGPGNFEPSGDDCPLCGGTNLQSFSATAFDCPEKSDISVKECNSCRFAWQWPLVRSTDESAEYFADNYANAEQGTYFDKDKKRAICEMEMEYIESLTQAKGRLLDIGSGDGSFCESAYNFGWTAYGLDPAGPTRHEQSATGELCLINGDLSNLQTDHKFDVITMWDVVEHLENPLNIIDACKNYLRQDGWLILETGNFQSVDRVKSGNNWWCYQKDHRWYFTPSALSDAIKTVGFKNISICEKTLRPWVNSSGKFRGPSGLEFVKRSIRRPWLLPANLAEFRDLTKLSKSFPDFAHLSIFALAAQISH